MQASELRSIDAAPLKRGTRVLLRLDLNVPCRDGAVYDDYRITRSMPTMKRVSEAGCRTVIVSHLDPESSSTLRPVFEYLKRSFSMAFAPALSDAEAMSKDIPDGGFLLVEDIRREAGEKENDPVLAKRLAALADIFISDAFAVSHRSHASVVGVPKLLPSFAGLLIAEEITQLSVALHPPAPSLFVLGGAKFETKLPLLLKFLDRYTRVFVGGALSNDIFHAMKLPVGSSLVSPLAPDLSTIIGRPNLRTPIDVTVDRGGVSLVVKPELVEEGDRIVDAGPKTASLLEEFADESVFALWNGPLGEYQNGHSEQTVAFARAMAGSGARSVVGGGDTVASIEKLGVMDKFNFVSTGGGAMLEFLAKETLPGLEALKES